MTWIKPQPRHLQMTQWGWICSYVENLEIGQDSDIAAFVYIQAKNGVVIGRGVKIGSHTSIYSEDTIGGHSGKVVLHDGCCVGSHSLIMPGVEIGLGITIPAFSFVKHSISSQEDLDAFLMRENKRPFNFGGLL